MRFLAAALLPLALLGAGCDIRIDSNGVSSVGITEGRAEDVWTRTYRLAAGGTLEIDGHNGRIEVTGGAGPDVEIRAEREVETDTDDAAKQILAKMVIREEVAPDRVKISSPDMGKDDWGLPGLGGVDARITYQVRVPAGLTLTLRTENGGIRLERVEGRITAATTNGGITGEAIRGALAAEVVNGGVRVEMAAVAGDVRLSSTNGGVRVTVPRDVKARLEASCVNGGIEVDDVFGIRIDGEGRGKRLEAPLNGGGPVISATTVNGGIRIAAG